MAISRDGRRIASTRGGMIQLWEADTGRPLHTHGPQPVADHRPGLPPRRPPARLDRLGWHRPALGRRDRGQVHLLRGPWGIAFAAAYSPDATRLAVAFTDGTIRLWDPADGRDVRPTALREHRAHRPVDRQWSGVQSRRPLADRVQQHGRSDPRAR